MPCMYAYICMDLCVILQHLHTHQNESSFFQDECEFQSIFVPTLVCGVRGAAGPDSGHDAVQQCAAHHAHPGPVHAL